MVEHYGAFPTVINAAVQTEVGNWKTKNQPGNSVIIPTAESEFHVYGCQWTADELTFSVDGQVFWTYTAPMGKAVKGFPFRWPYYLAATLSVGGERGPMGTLNAKPFPAHYYLDYVRVYQLGG